MSGRPDRWLVSYADLVTLLFALFLVLFALSHPSQRRFRTLADSLSASLGRVPQRCREESDLVRSLRRDLEGYSDGVELTEEKRGVVVVAGEALLFDSGRAVLRPEGRRLLRKIALTARRYPRPLRVEGHTDNVPISTPRFRSNWELSVLRAVAVAQELIALGVPPERLELVGYGEHHPRDSNGTAAGRARNRRVELVFVAGSVPPRPGQ